MSWQVLLLSVVLLSWTTLAREWPRAASWSAPSRRHARAAPGDFSMLLLHTNDMHARFEEIDKSAGECKKEAKERDECFGGFARVAHVVREERAAAASGAGPPVVFLNAGDTYQGTVWYSVHKWRIVVALMNLLLPDAVSLGNHEFDDGPEGLRPFLEQAKFPVVAANVNVTSEPALRGISLRPSIVLTVAAEGGDKSSRRVGVVGYLTPETKQISNVGAVDIEDEVAAIDREAKRLKSQGVNIIFAVGHSGYETDKRIAEEVPDIDVVVGGHTNTFLYTPLESAPSNEVPYDLYPTKVTQKSGRVVPVVQAYAYTKYMGRLHLVFNAQGELHSFDGNPQLLNSSVQEDAEMLDEIAKWRGQVLARKAEELGRAGVALNGNSRLCRHKECNMGNLLTDAFVAYNLKRYSAGNFPPWTNASIALQHSGGIRNSVERSSSSSVTAGDLLAVLPFVNRIYLCTLNGSILRSVLEHSSFTYQPGGHNNGDFLQVSGLRVTYDVRKPVNERVVKVSVLCAQCEDPKYEPLEENGTYNALIPEFIVDGGNGYTMLQAIKEQWCRMQNYTDYDAAVEYIRTRSPVFAMVENRITFATESKIEEVKGAGIMSLPSLLYVLLLLLIPINH